MKLTKSSSKVFHFSLKTDICSTFDASDLIFKNVSLIYCELTFDGCQNTLTVAASSSEIKVSNLEVATCYNFTYEVETEFNTTIVSKTNETFCTGIT